MRPATVFAALSLLVAATGCDSAPADPRLDGPTDTHATRACDVAAGSATALTAASAAADPPVLAVDTAYRVTMPESGPGYVHVRVVDEHTDLAFFSAERGVFAAFEGDALGTSRRNGSCPDRLREDFRVHVHDVRDYLLTLSADAPRELTVLVLQTGAGHDPRDGGVHAHEDGGHHHHDEDAGAHHHHDDAGAHHGDGGSCGAPNADCHDDGDCCSGDCHDHHCH